MSSIAARSVAGPAVSISQQVDGLTFNWPDGQVSFFHHIWLRDCCYCASCGDTYSSNRYLKPSDVSLDVSPRTVAIEDGQWLVVEWSADGHRSRYSLDWLRANCYSDAARTERFHRPITWGAQIVSALPSVRFDVAQSDKSVRLEFFRKLRDYGFVVVRGGPIRDDGVEAVANLIGDVSDSAYGKIFDLSPKAAIKTLGNTFDPVPPHTDEAYRHCPPGVNVLHCVRPAKVGGASVLVDGFHLGELLRARDAPAFHLLVTQPQPFHRVVRSSGIDQRTRGPVFVLDEFGTIVGFRFHTRSAAPLDVPANLMPAVYAANHKLSAMMMSGNNQVRFRLEAGDAVLFDNQRVMHSREGFNDVERKLRICSVSREQLHEQLRLLAHELGYADEANQVLAAGLTG
jgi:gamma-butyrobetaine dioxygenase